MHALSSLGKLQETLTVACPNARFYEAHAPRIKLGMRKVTRSDKEVKGEKDARLTIIAFIVLVQTLV
jgi:hypothetical protein